MLINDDRQALAAIKQYIKTEHLSVENLTEENLEVIAQRSKVSLRSIKKQVASMNSGGETLEAMESNKGIEGGLRVKKTEQREKPVFSELPPTLDELCADLEQIEPHIAPQVFTKVREIVAGLKRKDLDAITPELLRTLDPALQRIFLFEAIRRMSQASWMDEAKSFAEALRSMQKDKTWNEGAGRYCGEQVGVAFRQMVLNKRQPEPRNIELKTKANGIGFFQVDSQTQAITVNPNSEKSGMIGDPRGIYVHRWGDDFSCRIELASQARVVYKRWNLGWDHEDRHAAPKTCALKDVNTEELVFLRDFLREKLKDGNEEAQSSEAFRALSGTNKKEKKEISREKRVLEKGIAALEQAIQYRENPPLPAPTPRLKKAMPQLQIPVAWNGDPPEKVAAWEIKKPLAKRVGKAALGWTGFSGRPALSCPRLGGGWGNSLGFPGSEPGRPARCRGGTRWAKAS